MGASLNQNQAYTYDGLNRLKTAAESGSGTAWSQTYAYDRYGNRRVTAGAAHGSNQALTPQSTADIAASTNRLAGTKGVNLTVAYDAAGNLKADWAGNAFKYDGDNRLVAFDAPMGTDSDTAYAYDGEGRRVRKVVGGSSGVTTTYVYNVLGQLVAEFGGTASGRPGTRYLTPDPLGSTRVVTAEDQSVLSRHDYLPFGEEIGAALGNRNQASGISGYTASLADGPAQKFTGKERDNESGLDYFQARYFSGAGGRFTSADLPFADQHVENPQSWNLYSYTRNSPLKYVDRTGNLLESPWDVFNVAIGVASFVHNVKQGNYGWAAVDAIGVVVDVAATAVPGAPGGAATVIRASRAAGGVARAVNKADNAAGVATNVNRTDNIRAATSRGRESEQRVLKERGLSKNTKKVRTEEGASIPDALTDTKVVEIKDTKGVSLTGQLRNHTRFAKDSGRKSVLITGENTRVTKNVDRAFDKIERQSDLGPQ